ncbi:radical SAM protein [Moraxella osloensis]|nr:viperin family antiviral radical SAM protein [Moraxella osloensis]OBX55279.1 radical SAM protein [Moraxella osloensis]
MNNHITNLENKELVVNWHITEACNFKCTYCFAKWDKDSKELIHNVNAVENLLDELLKLPHTLNQKYGTKFTGLRLNLVGGETFLYQSKVLNIIHEAKKRGFTLSAITNASKLNDKILTVIAENFCSIGFSVDSIEDVTNLKIGRSQKDMPMNITKMLKDITHLRQLNLELDIKINTVVSSLNYTEDLSKLIEVTQPSKWKIFKVLPSITNEYAIGDNDFLSFLSRHASYNDIIFSEDNDEMTDSYLMVDPLGRFFQNSNQGKGYIYSDGIVDSGVEVALNQVNFDIDKFLGRYRQKLIPLVNVA